MASRIIKEKGVTPNELEEEVAKALNDLEAAPGNDMRAELKELKFSGAKEIECQGAKNAIVIFIPFKIAASIKKVTAKLIRELEKKFQKRHVLIVANRTIMGKNFRRKGIEVRPRTRTLTNVHEAILEDVVFPTEITGKRTRVKMDGSKVIKIFLDKKDKEQVEEKLSVFSSVYRQLTNKDAQFFLA